MRKLICLALLTALAIPLGCGVVEQHQKMQAEYLKDAMSVLKRQPAAITVLRLEAFEGKPIQIMAKSLTVQMPNTAVVDVLKNVKVPKAPYEDAINTAAGGITNALTLGVGGYFVEKILGTAMTAAGHNTTINDSYNGDHIGGDYTAIGGNYTGGDWTGGDKIGGDRVGRDKIGGDRNDNDTTNNHSGE